MKLRAGLPWGAIGSIAAGTAAIAAHASRFGSWIVDDAAITFAYARSVASGLGPVLQPGAAPVEGYSNPSWLALLTVGRWLGLFDHGSLFGIPDYVFYPKALALLCCIGILIAIYRAAAVVTRRAALVTLCAGLLLALIPSFVIWSFSGLENSLFAFLVTALASLLMRAVVEHRMLTAKVAILAGVLAALAALTRPDGLIYVAAFPILALLRVTRPTLVPVIKYSALSGLAFAVPYGGYIAYRLVEFGQLLSMTAVAKGQQPPDTQTLIRVSEVIGYGGALAALVVVVCLGIVIIHPSKLRLGLVALLVPLSLALAAHSVLMPDWMGEQRFATPIWPLFALLAALAVGAATVQLNLRARVVLVLAVVVALVPSVSTFKDKSALFRASPTFPMCFVAERMGHTFEHYADLLGVQQGTVLMPDIGGSALTTRMVIVDTAGLAEPRIAKMRGEGTVERDLANYVFDEAKPTFIHEHPAWDPKDMAKDPRLTRDYVPIYNPESVQGHNDWVRRDAVKDPKALEAARAYATVVAGAAYVTTAENPRRSCGDTLRPQ
ncbi:hypothetical protein [Actinocrispum sp. NPDC049592]|uniref:hypothetical protein n=1 Tax=Actinocrispum sp. NPDC049592 TaxID=3154835 RepID=UPI0034465727